MKHAIKKAYFCKKIKTMFSPGQLLFASIFFIAFSIVIYFSYKKDTKLHSKNYKGIKWIGLTFVIFILSLLIIKHLLKN